MSEGKPIEKIYIPLGLRCTQCNLFYNECTCDVIHYSLPLSKELMDAMERPYIEYPATTDCLLESTYIPDDVFRTLLESCLSNDSELIMRLAEESVTG